MIYVGLCGGGEGPVDGVHTQLSLVFDFYGKKLSTKEIKSPERVSIPHAVVEEAV